MNFKTYLATIDTFKSKLTGIGHIDMGWVPEALDDLAIEFLFLKPLSDIERIKALVALDEAKKASGICYESNQIELDRLREAQKIIMNFPGWTRKKLRKSLTIGDFSEVK